MLNKYLKPVQELGPRILTTGIQMSKCRTSSQQVNFIYVRCPRRRLVFKMAPIFRPISSLTDGLPIVFDITAGGDDHIDSANS